MDELIFTLMTIILVGVAAKIFDKGKLIFCIINFRIKQIE